MSVLNKLIIRRINGLTESLYEIVTRLNEDEGLLSFYNLPTVTVELEFANSNNIEPTRTHYIKTVHSTYITVFETPIILLSLGERIEALYPKELHITHDFYDMNNKVYGSKIVFPNRKDLKITFGLCPKVSVNTI